MKTLSEGYRPRDIYNRNEQLREVIDLINSGLFSHGDPGLFRPLTETLLHHDPFLLLADYQSYVDCQAHVDTVYKDRARWTYVDPQRGTHGQVLFGSIDSGILRPYLESKTNAGIALTGISNKGESRSNAHIAWRIWNLCASWQSRLDDHPPADSLR